MSDQDKSRETELMHRVAAPGALRDVLLDMWQRTRIDWSFARDGLGAALRKQAGLGPRERRGVTELLYGMIRHLRRLDQALAAGGMTLRAAGPPPDLARLVAYLVLEAELAPAAAARVAPGVDWQAAARVDEILAREPRATRRIALSCSLPDWLAQALVDAHGARAEALARALNQRAPMTLRANTLATSRADLAAWLAEEGVKARPTRHARDGLVVEGRGNLFGLRAFRRGAFELQDEGSQLIAELVAPPPRSRVVDYCAGAGGKSLALAALLGNRGRVVAADVDARKLHELRRRARRAGATNVHAVTLAREGGWPPALARVEGMAARVLVDAPCSAVGTLRRHPEVRWRLGRDEAARYPALQVALCERALSLLEPGGLLIYATCTLLPAENQEVVERVLAAHAGLSLVPAQELAAGVWGADAATALVDASGRFLALDPARHDTDGFFAAALRRDA